LRHPLIAAAPLTQSDPTREPARVRKVVVTALEEERVVELAAGQDVTVARLLVESALAGATETPSQRRRAMVELFAIRRLLANVANKVNQLARAANITGEQPGATHAALADVGRVVGRIDQAIDGLSGS
jgi:hypothetical protein